MAKVFEVGELVEVRSMRGRDELWAKATYVRAEVMPAFWKGPGVHVVRLQRDNKICTVPAVRIRKL